MYVSHYEDDGMWQFLCGKAHETDEAKLVSLKSVFDLDNSVGILKDMPCGYYAERKAQDDEMETIAQRVVQEQGYSYPVKAELVTMPFTERTYEDLTMPAGTYEAIRITIGAAAGKNWWCVMYPPLCIPVAEDVAVQDEQAKAYFSDAEQDVLYHPERYRIKWKLAEWFKKWTTSEQTDHTTSHISDLLHNTSSTNAEILDELLTKWEEMGYSFGSLDQLASKSA